MNEPTSIAVRTLVGWGSGRADAVIDWVVRWLPPVLVRTEIADTALWQWLALPVLITFALLLSLLFTRLLERPMASLARHADPDAGELHAHARAPMRALVSFVVFSLLLPALDLSGAVGRLGQRIGIVGIALSSIWLGSRVADALARRAETRMIAAGRLDAAGLMPTAARVVKIVVSAVVLVMLAQNLGLNVTGVLAGLGVGGLAIALAAQKTVENLFGGLTLVADRPVQVGDFCRFGDRLGTIEAIGLRSTRVRTLDRTVVSVPNSEFSNLQLESYSARDRIWLNLVLGLRYETGPGQLRDVLASLRALLRDHPRIETESSRVRFIALGAYSLDVEIFAYVLTNDYNEYLAVREEILLAIMDAIAAAGTSFAFPSQTVYGRSDTGSARSAESASGAVADSG